MVLYNSPSQTTTKTDNKNRNTLRLWYHLYFDKHHRSITFYRHTATKCLLPLRFTNCKNLHLTIKSGNKMFFKLSCYCPFSYTSLKCETYKKANINTSFEINVNASQTFTTRYTCACRHTACMNLTVVQE